jgi:hypothetical protein
MGSAVGVFSAVLPYIASLSSLFVPLSAPAEQSQGRPVLGQTCHHERKGWAYVANSMKLNTPHNFDHANRVRWLIGSVVRVRGLSGSHRRWYEI